MKGTWIYSELLSEYRKGVVLVGMFTGGYCPYILRVFFRLVLERWLWRNPAPDPVFFWAAETDKSPAEVFSYGLLPCALGEQGRQLPGTPFALRTWRRGPSMLAICFLCPPLLDIPNTAVRKYVASILDRFACSTEDREIHCLISCLCGDALSTAFKDLSLRRPALRRLAT